MNKLDFTESARVHMSPVPDTATLVVDLPKFDFCVHRAGEYEVGRAGKPADDRDALAVSRPCVDLSFRDETLGRRLARLQIDAQVLGRVQEGATLVVLSNKRSIDHCVQPENVRKKFSK
jgi:hypothetical protein